MLALVMIVVLGFSVLGSDLLAHRLTIAPPIVLLIIGVLVGFVPALRDAHLPPETVLLVFLPALLYWESLTTSLREIRYNLRAIMLASTVLVVLTAAAVAAAAHLLGMPWAPAWVLGAALAPTDATAVGVMAHLLPHRTVTTLRAESLINDGTALVVYGLALGVATGSKHLGALHVGWLFLVSYLGGAACGIATAWIAVHARKRLNDPLQENVATLLTPFVAFLAAEAIDASGVLAVVVCGLIMSQAGPRVGSADTRHQTAGFWTLSTYLLNASLFVLVGLELQSAARGLTSVDLTRGVISVVLIAAVTTGVRFAWLFSTPYLIRVLDRRPERKGRRTSARTRIVNGLSGFRGAVSLAAALAVPQTVTSGQHFPDRDLIIFITGGVIVLTLAQGLLLPHVVAWANLPYDSTTDDELRMADTTATQDALSDLSELASTSGSDPKVTNRIRQELETRLRVLRAGHPEADDAVTLDHHAQYADLHRTVIDHERATVLRLRDEQHIDDTSLRALQARLDLEELRLPNDE